MMNEEREPHCTEEECIEAFDLLFPNGFEGEDVIAELAPDGWEASPLAVAFHPSVEQVHEEIVRMHENFARLFHRGDSPPNPPPTFEETSAEYTPEPYEPAQEIRDLVGRCMWDIFSDNHEVISPDGRTYDLGSFRSSGGFIADYLNERVPGEDYNYMNFYMGTSMIRSRADMTPVYQLIFSRIRSCGMDWRYHFPRLMLVDMKPLTDQLKGEGKPEWEGYSPEEAVKEDSEEAKRQEELSETRASLDKAYRESVAAAQETPPPDTVAAYRSIFRRLPQGWPPVVEE